MILTKMRLVPPLLTISYILFLQNRSDFHWEFFRLYSA